jgi:membrane protein
MSTHSKKIHRNLLTTVTRKTIKNWFDDNASLLAAGIAYNLVFAIGPLLFLFLFVIGFIFPLYTYQDQLFNNLQGITGRANADILITIINNISSSANSGITATLIFIGLFVTIFGFINQLRNATNIIWHNKYPHTPPLSALGNLKIIGVLLFITLLWGVYFTLSNVINIFVLTENNTQLVTISKIGIQFIINIVSYAIGLQTLIQYKISWKLLFFGSTLITICFQIGTQILRYYYSFIIDSPVFGAAGTFALLLLWIYVSTQIFIFGMELIKTIHYYNPTKTVLQ